MCYVEMIGLEYKRISNRIDWMEEIAMKVYRETADASMYYRETAAADYVRVNSSAFPISFPRVIQLPVPSPQVEGIEPAAGMVRHDLGDPSIHLKDD